jgi:subtilisin family serine protease
MLRSLVAAVLLLVPASGSAATERYVVALEPGPAMRRLVVAGRDVVSFPSLDAFAADLTEAEAQALRRSAGVRYVEAVAERHILGMNSRPAASALRNLDGQTVPPGLDIARAREVWPVTRGESINVAVIDTGIDYRHPDLAPAYAGGYNAITQSNDPMDDHDHGTHVAGVIAAADNDVGIVGLAPRVRLWGVKAMRETGAGTTDHVVGAIDWVIARKRALGGNWIINLSIGAQTPNSAEAEAVARAIDEGILVVAGSGNDSTAAVAAPVSYPAAYPGVVAVGAVDEALGHAPFSNQGPQLAGVGLGVDVLSSVRAGTGLLTAVVTGSGTLGGVALEGSGKGTVTGAIVYCGIGRAEDFPAAVSGQIAVVRRGGGVTFADKAKRAKQAGATAVLVVDYAESQSHIFSLFDGTDPGDRSYPWPVTIALSNADGEGLISAAGSTITVANRTDDYGSKTGTSMAAPHAAGVAALVWSVAPHVRAATIAGVLKQAARDLGAPGADHRYGHGLLRAYEAAAMMNPAAFGVPPSGRRVLRRGR